MSQHMAVELLSSYLDEEVTQAQLRLVEDHLRGCGECRGTLAGLSSISESVRRLEAVPPPATLAAAVEHRVRLASLERRRGLGLEAGLKRWLGQPVLAPVFAIVLALGAIFYLFAIGVSELEQRRTRLVVATVPAAEDQASGLEIDALATPEVGTRAERQDLDLADAPHDRPVAKTSESSPAAEPVGRAQAVSVTEVAGAAEVAERRAVLLSELKVMREKSRAEAEEVVNEAEVADAAVPERESPPRVASAVSATGAADRVAAAASEPGPQMNDLDSEAPEIRMLAGRRFVERDGVWIEVGLEGESRAELVDLRTGSGELGEDLSVFRDLGRVRLRVGDRIVEVVYPQPEVKD